MDPFACRDNTRNVIDVYKRQSLSRCVSSGFFTLLLHEFPDLAEVYAIGKDKHKWQNC